MSVPAVLNPELTAVWQAAEAKQDIGTLILCVVQQAIYNEPAHPADAANPFLTSLAAHLPTTQLPAALVQAKGIRDSWQRAYLLAQLAPALPPSYEQMALREALTAVEQISDEQDKETVLAHLLPQLNGKLLAQAIHQVSSLNTAGLKARLLPQCAVSVPSAQQERLLQEAIDAAFQAGPRWDLTQALTNLTPQLTDALKQRLAARLQRIADPWERAHKLMPLIPHLDRPQQKALLTPNIQEAMRLPDAMRRRVLGEYAPYLPAKLLLELMTAARALDEEWARAHLLEQLIPVLPETMTSDLRQQVQRVQAPELRARLLLLLLPRLPEAEQTAVLPQIRQLLHRLHDRPDMPLIQLTPLVPDSMLPEVMQALPKAPDALRAQLISQLLPRQTDQWLPPLLTAILSLSPLTERRVRLRQIYEVGLKLAAWAQADSVNAYASWVTLMQTLAAQTPEAVLAVLTPLRPFTFALIPTAQQAQTAVRLYQTIPDILEAA